MNPINSLKSFLRDSDLIRIFSCDYKKSYSQSGEDLIVDFIFNALHIKTPTYLDIGAHHPTYLSNTYYFYKKGCHGVCIEPDPHLFRKILGKRRRDICLNVGVGTNVRTLADFYIMTTRTLSTFSEEEATRYQRCDNQKIERVAKIPLISVNDIIHENFNYCPNFISLDVEGLELEILKSFNFNMYRPEVFCVETLTYAEDKSEKKTREILNFMVSNNYMAYGDTYINTIFVERHRWVDR